MGRFTFIYFTFLLNFDYVTSTKKTEIPYRSLASRIKLEILLKLFYRPTFIIDRIYYDFKTFRKLETRFKSKILQ